MGTYNLNKEEIANILDDLAFESYCQGDFTEQVVIDGAKEYIKRLRKEGAYIPKK